MKTNLCRVVYIDKHADKTDQEKEAVTIKFQEIGEAYEVLSNPELRAKYDRGEDVFENQGGQQQQYHHGFPFQFFQNMHFHRG